MCVVLLSAPGDLYHVSKWVRMGGKAQVEQG